MNLLEFLADHTYRMVFFGTAIIGFVAGALGTFAYLRKQSLISDVISHSALPGALAAFLVAVSLGVDGRNMLVLTVGAVVVATVASLLANAIANYSKIAIDTAMAVVLASFFGGGMLLMRIITNGRFPGKGGIQDYLFGNASVITRADMYTTAAIGALALAVMGLFFKEFAARTFDPAHAEVLGFSGRIVDVLMFGTIVTATVLGVKSVGLVLMVALVVTPPAVARQWTRTLPTMLLLSGTVGAVSCGLGAYLSVSLGKVPTGPVIVVVLFVFLVVSLLAAPGRSVLARAWRRAAARRELKLLATGKAEK